MRWHLMAKVEPRTGHILAQFTVCAETLPDAFAEARFQTGESNSNDLRFFGYVEGEREPLRLLCQCEHVCHLTPERPRTPHGFYGHAETHSEQVLFTARTNRGTFYVCLACKTDCLAQAVEDYAHEMAAR